MSDDEIDPEIAAAMGFTSFGSKRRKHTSRNDDAVVGDDGSMGAYASTGANDVALGVRVVRGGNTAPLQNAVGEGDVQEVRETKEEKTLPVDKTGGKMVEQAQEEQTQVQEMKGWTQGWPSAEELATLRRGVRNSRGDMVVFLPGFVDDPWKGLR